MARNEFVKARVSPEEKEIYQQLCEQAGCTEAELIRSVLIHREISLDDLDDEMQVIDRKKCVRRWNFDMQLLMRTTEILLL